MINYQEEVTRLDEFEPSEGGNFWKPKAGQYKVKALTELEEAEPFKKQGEEDKPQFKVKLLIDGLEEVEWTVALGKSPASSYGQLCKLAIDRSGSLIDQEFLIAVTNDGIKNTYTIVNQ